MEWQELIYPCLQYLAALQVAAFALGVCLAVLALVVANAHYAFNLYADWYRRITDRGPRRALLDHHAAPCGMNFPEVRDYAAP